VALLLAHCTVSAPRADPLDISSPAMEPEHSGEQAEVTSAIAQAPSGAQVLVAAYRYTGPHKFPESPVDDFVYSTDGTNDVIVRDGASIAGWSFSLDGGITWHVNSIGKIYPKVFQFREGVPVYGDPIAVLWGDPSLMAGFKNRRLVALSNLAISRQSFDANKNPMDGAIHGFPSGKPNIIDSGCVALSTDGGQHFNNLYCIRPSDIGVAGSDQSAVGIDKNDAIFLAFDDFSHHKIDLYQIFVRVINGQVQVFFNQLAIDPQMGDPQTGQASSRAPRIARDQDGELWLTAATPSGELRMCHIRAASTPFGSGGCDFVGVVTQRPAPPFPALRNSNTGGIRTGVVASFAVNRVKSTQPEVVAHTDFYFAYHRVFTTDDMQFMHIGATMCRLEGFAPLACHDVDAWGTGSATHNPQELQPAVVLVARADGGGANPQYAYYQTDAGDIDPGHARVKRARLFGDPFGGAPPTSIHEDLPLAPDPMVCTAKGYGPAPYWGDFFGFAFVPLAPNNLIPRHVAIYSSDDRDGCPSKLQTNAFQGRHLHVVSWFWPD
jgi:hypothetical protein